MALCVHPGGRFYTLLSPVACCPARAAPVHVATAAVRGGIVYPKQRRALQRRDQTSVDEHVWCHWRMGLGCAVPGLGCL